jgi:hypothetical protein
MANAADSKAPPPVPAEPSRDDHEGDPTDRPASAPPAALPEPDAALPDNGDGKLEAAILLAAQAGQWTAVELLSAELKARRLARAGNVVTLDPKRARRGGGS